MIVAILAVEGAESTLEIEGIGKTGMPADIFTVEFKRYGQMSAEVRGSVPSR